MKNSYFMVGGLLFIPTLPSFFGLCSLPAWSTQYWALTLVCHCVDRAFSEALFSNLSITFYNAFLWVTFLGLLTWNLVAKALLTVAKLFDSPYFKADSVAGKQNFSIFVILTICLFVTVSFDLPLSWQQLPEEGGASHRSSLLSGGADASVVCTVPVWYLDVHVRSMCISTIMILIMSMVMVVMKIMTIDVKVKRHHILFQRSQKKRKVQKIEDKCSRKPRTSPHEDHPLFFAPFPEGTDQAVCPSRDVEG